LRVTGRHLVRTVGGEEVASFVPEPLPPRDPPLEMGATRLGLLIRAEQALARLEVAGELVPSLDWFICGRRPSSRPRSRGHRQPSSICSSSRPRRTVAGR